jgi:hypothetical protein
MDVTFLEGVLFSSDQRGYLFPGVSLNCVFYLGGVSRVTDYVKRVTWFQCGVSFVAGVV